MRGSRERAAWTALAVLPPASAAWAPQPRKCVQGGRTMYTDQSCPVGSQKVLVDGALTTLPARR